MFGEWLRQQRNQLKLTRGQFAECVGCSVALLRKIEDGERRPSTQIAELIANCLNIPPVERSTFVKVARGELSVDRLPPPSKRITSTSVSPASTPPRTKLPVFPTPLIGRQREVEELSQLLGDPQCRLLTLVGPGGIGKTRLAIETASRLQDVFADGVYFVPLAPVNTTRFIVPVIADAIGFAFQSAGPTDPKTQLFSYLKEKQALLLMDNLEQLLTEPGIEVLAELLASASQVKLVATSRESLELQDEWVFEVQGLPIPESQYAEGSAENTSVELFLQRARRAHVAFNATPEDYPTIVRVCRLVDGNPLAIELAAAWVRTLSCGEIEREIERGLDFLSVSTRDLPARHRSMRAVFDQSYRLLSEEERGVLRRLSVFRGGFAREAADEIAGATLSQLSTLQSKSLLRRVSGGRYDLHELVRQYAAAQLHENPEEESEARDGHSHYYLSQLRTRATALHSDRQVEALAELNAEVDNLRAAWDWAATRQEIAELRQTVWCMWYYYELRNLFQEGEAMLLHAVESARTLEVASETEAAARELALAHLQVFPAYFALHLGRVAEAQTDLEQSLQLIRRHGDQAALVDALCIQATVHMVAGQFDQSTRCAQEGFMLARAAHRQWETATCAVVLGRMEFQRGNFAESKQWLDYAYALSRAMGDPVVVCYAIGSLGQTMHALGRFIEMEPILREGVRLSSETGHRFTFGLLVEQLAQIAQAKGQLEEAGQLYRECIRLYREQGDVWSLSRALTALGKVQVSEEDAAGAERCFRESLELATNAHLEANVIDALAGIARLRAKDGGNMSALELAARIVEHPAASHEAKTTAERLCAELQSQLTPQQIETVQAQARTKPLEAFVQALLSASTR